MITIEDIKTEHAKVAEMIAAFEKQPIALEFPVTISLPKLNKGEKFAGVIISACGTKRHILILLPGSIEKGEWQESMDWAKSIGGDLPDRTEASLLNATLNDEFEPAYYWTNTQHASYSDYAWYQNFLNGFQDTNYKSSELRARAVRRLAIS